MLHVQLHKERDPLAVGWDKAMGKHLCERNVFAYVNGT